jgi:hypothetical protein
MVPTHRSAKDILAACKSPAQVMFFPAKNARFCVKECFIDDRISLVSSIRAWFK